MAEENQPESTKPHMFVRHRCRHCRTPFVHDLFAIDGNINASITILGDWYLFTAVLYSFFITFVVFATNRSGDFYGRRRELLFNIQ